jgi:hypothetical protein
MPDDIFKTYDSRFAEIDISAEFRGNEPIYVEALSYSVTREMAPIYTMGSADASAFTRGKRGIAGTLRVPEDTELPPGKCNLICRAMDPHGNMVELKITGVEVIEDEGHPQKTFIAESVSSWRLAGTETECEEPDIAVAESYDKLEDIIV